MPYQRRRDLPAAVRNNLPLHAQDVYKSAFNNAYQEYDHDETRAHQVAWSAVKRHYEKRAGGGWGEKS